jgi:hypothetical protein
MKLDTIVRVLRVLFGTITVVALFGVGGAIAATKFAQADLEDRAIESARKVATSSIAPVLQPRDAERPLQGPRYVSLLTIVRRDVLPGPISGVTIWSDDGTVLFADDRATVGRTEGSMKQTIASIGRASAVAEVDEDRFLTFVPLAIAKDGPKVTAELVRSHEAIVAQSRQRWWDWVGKAGRIGAMAFVLYLLVVGAGAALAAQRRRAADAARTTRPLPGSVPVAPGRAPERGKERAKERGGAGGAAEKARAGMDSLLKRVKRNQEPEEVDEPVSSLKEALAAIEPKAPVAAPEPAAGGSGSGGPPAYLQPGFREVEETRRKVERELAASLQERARLEDRVRQLEGELAEARRRLSMADAQ